MSVSVTYAATCTVVETLPNNTGSAPTATRQVTHTEYNESASLNSGSTPPATLVAEWLQALSGGAATVDLTALTGTNGATVDGTGLKPQVIRIKNLGANALTVATGASNGHNSFTADGVVIPPSGHAMFFLNDGKEDIDATHKTFDLTGTTTQTSEWTIVLG